MTFSKEYEAASAPKRKAEPMTEADWVLMDTLLEKPVLTRAEELKLEALTKRAENE